MNQTLKWTAIAGLFLIPFTPLIISSSLLFPFITGKAFFFRIVIDIVFALYVVLALRDPSYRPKKSWLSVATFVFMVVVLLADIFGINPNKSIWSNFERSEGFFMVLHLWMFYIAASGLLIKKYWHYWMGTSVGISVIAFIYGLFQVFGKIGIRQGAERIDGTLGNASYFAVYMLLNLGFVLYLSLQKHTPTWAKILSYLIALAQLFIIFKTATRGTALGIAVALVVCSAIYVWKGKEDKIGRIVAGIILAIVLISGISLYAGKNTSFVKSHVALNRLASISLDNARTKYIWPIAWQGIKEHPVLGYGQEGFNYAFNKYYNSHMWTEEQWFDRAHNVFIDWFVSTGFLGFAMYVILYLFALKYIWKGNFSLKEKIVLIGLLIAYAVHNMTIFDNLSSYILFFALLAFLHNQRAKDYIKEIKINIDIKELIVIPVVIIACGSLLYFASILPIRVSGMLVSAMQAQKEGLVKNLELLKKANSYNVTGGQEVREQTVALSEEVIKVAKDPQVQMVFFELAKQAIDNQATYAPDDARGYILAGAFYNRLGQFDLSLPALIKAHELTPNKQTPLFELGSRSLNIKEYDKAVEYFKKAYDLDPNYPEAKRLYNIALEQVGKPQI